MQLKKVVRDSTPEFALVAIRKFRSKMALAKLAPPVVQIFINDGEVETTAGFNNFVSFLVASVNTTGHLQVTLRDADGKLLYDEKTKLDHFENRFLPVKSLLAEKSASAEYGLITLRFVPDRLRTDAYKSLGTLASQFFLFFKSKSGAVATVHPSSTLDPNSPPSGAFLSNQVINTNGLEAVTLYQCNPSQNSHQLTIGLKDAETGEIICSQELELPPMAVRKLNFDAGSAFERNSRPLRVFATSLPTANSKPMLRRCYPGGRFSMNHS